MSKNPTKRAASRRKSGIENPKESIRRVIAEGEGYGIEFKEGVSGLDKDIVAFANASGGTIYLGVSDNGSIKPMRLTNRLRSELVSIARNCDPPIRIDVSQLGDIICIFVPEGDAKPHGCSGGYYLRIGPNSQKMKTQELVEFVTASGRPNFDSVVNIGFPFARLDERNAIGLFARAGLDVKGWLEDAMCNLNLAKRTPDGTYLTHGGVLLFAEDPTIHLMSAYTTCVRYKGTDKVKIIDRKDFRTNIIEQVKDAMAFIERNTRLEYVIDGSIERKEIPEYPPEPLREALINAVLHRNYSDHRMVTQIDVFDDRIEIVNPGGLMRGMTADELGRRALHRNPVLVDFFRRLDMIEKIGSGIKRMREGMLAAGHPEPTFEPKEIWFNVIFRKKTEAIAPGLSRDQAGTKSEQSQTRSPVGGSDDIGKVTPQVTTQVAMQDTMQVTMQERTIMAMEAGTLSGNEIMRKIGLKNRDHFRREYLVPAIKSGIVEMTIPEKPNSRLQKYRLTEAGRKELERLKNRGSDDK